MFGPKRLNSQGAVNCNIITIHVSFFPGLQKGQLWIKSWLGRTRGAETLNTQTQMTQMTQLCHSIGNSRCCALCSKLTIIYNASPVTAVQLAVQPEFSLIPSVSNRLICKAWGQWNATTSCCASKSHCGLKPKHPNILGITWHNNTRTKRVASPATATVWTNSLLLQLVFLIFTVFLPMPSHNEGPPSYVDYHYLNFAVRLTSIECVWIRHVLVHLGWL